jgi:hypothetical protein
MQYSTCFQLHVNLYKRFVKLFICYFLFYNQHLNVLVAGGCYPLKQLDLFPFKKAKTSTKMLNQKFHGSVPTLPSCVKYNFLLRY